MKKQMTTEIIIELKKEMSWRVYFRRIISSGVLVIGPIVYGHFIESLFLQIVGLITGLVVIGSFALRDKYSNRVSSFTEARVVLDKLEQEYLRHE